jgi:hypothetical protein
VLHRVPTATLPGSRYDSLLLRAFERHYPPSLQRVDTRLYARLGLANANLRARIASAAQRIRAWYDSSTHRLLLRRAEMPGRARLIHELVRALLDQHFDLRRLTTLRSRDRDRALAAAAIVEGTAALASGIRAPAVRGSSLGRLLDLEPSAGRGPGRALAAQLRYLGGRAALASALRTFPQTTEQLLHVDKFLERARALPIRLPSRIGTVRQRASETFGELHVRDLLHAFAVPDAAAVAAGWGGGRISLYVSPQGEAVAALVLRWDTPDDADEWRDDVPRYVAAAFAGATGHNCPPLDRCWSGPAEIAAGTLGERSVLVSGPGSGLVAMTLLRG